MNPSAISSYPKHLGVLVDGNRRWAKERGLSTKEGHAAGAARVVDLLHWCAELGIEDVTLYLLSTENLKRPAEELVGLTAVIENLLDQLLAAQTGPIYAVGNLSLLPTGLREHLEKTIRLSSSTRGVRINLAVGYGGRQEIVDAVKELLRDAHRAGTDLKTLEQSLSTADIASRLYTRHLPEPDLLIRTSGEQRLSGFLTWQSAYSEFYFCPALWPDFSREDLLAALEDYSRRHRRFGS